MLLSILLINSIIQNVKAQTYATLPFLEHFDKAWVNNTGIRDVPSKYWKSTPVTTNSSWSREDDGVSRDAWDDLYGSYSPSDARQAGHSARFHSFGTFYNTSGKLDLYVNFSTPAGNKTLTYYYIN